jgi:hypothetical protein
MRYNYLFFFFLGRADEIGKMERVLPASGAERDDAGQPGGGGPRAVHPAVFTPWEGG